MAYDPNTSLNPDLDGQICCVAMCFDVADTMGVITIRLAPEVGAPRKNNVQKLEIPLCIEHAHLLRMGGDLLRFDT